MQIPYLPVRGRKLPRFMGGSIGSTTEICETSGRKIPKVLHFHQCIGYIKSKLRVRKVQKCIALVGEDTVVTSAWLQTTRFDGGECKAQNGNRRNFGPTNPHGTAFAPKQWLYEKEATGMESSKMYCQKCIALVGADTEYLPVRGSKLPHVMRGNVGSTTEICETSGRKIPMVPLFHQSIGYIKRKLWARKVQKCIALVGEDTVLTSAWLQTTPCHGG